MSAARLSLIWTTICAVCFLVAPIAGQESSPPTGQGNSTADHGAAVAQEKSQGAQPLNSSGQDQVPTTVLKVTTRLVVVDAVVTDKNGKPVTDLKQGDFQILENGKAQQVRVYGFQSPAVAAASEKTPVESLPPGFASNMPEFHVTSGPPTVLLLDLLNTPVADQSAVRLEFEKFLASHPQQNTAVFAMGNKLRLLQDFTSDPQLLQAVMKKLAIRALPLNARNPYLNPREAVMEEIGSAVFKDMEAVNPEAARRLIDWETEKIATDDDNRVEVTMASFRELARWAAGYPGRKNLVWISGSFPFTLTFDPADSDRAMDAQRAYSAQVKRMADLFSDAQVAVYAIDAKGLVNYQPNNASSPVNYLYDRFSKEMSKRTDIQTSLLDSLREFAEQTGGKAFYNRNDIGNEIAESVADGSTYYTLGYYPENKKWDGKFRKIEVRVIRPGLQVRSRKGYFASDPRTAPHRDEKAERMEFLASLSPEAPSSTALPFVVQVRPPSQSSKAAVVSFRVEPHAIAFQPKDGLQHARVDFVVRAFDKDGKAVGLESQSMDGNFQPQIYAQIMKVGLRVPVKITLPPGKYTLEVGVRDVSSNLIGTTSAALEVN